MPAAKPPADPEDVPQKVLLICKHCERALPGEKRDDGTLRPYGVKYCPDCQRADFEVRGLNDS